MAGGFYAVKKGKKTGIFDSWQECQKQVSQFVGAEFKKFKTKREAMEFLNEGKDDKMKQKDGNQKDKDNAEIAKSECRVCNKDVEEEMAAVKCDRCEKWVHQECEQLPDGLFEAIDNEEVAKEVFWFCKDCKQIIEGNIEASRRERSRGQETDTILTVDKEKNAKENQLTTARSNFKDAETSTDDNEMEKRRKKEDSEHKQVKKELNDQKKGLEECEKDLYEERKMRKMAQEYLEQVKKVNCELELELDQMKGRCRQGKGDGEIVNEIEESRKGSKIEQGEAQRDESTAFKEREERGEEFREKSDEAQIVQGACSNKLMDKQSNKAGQNKEIEKKGVVKSSYRVQDNPPKRGGGESKEDVRLCKYHHKGLVCKFGSKCWFRHEKFGEMKEECNYFREGRICPYGQKCRFLHIDMRGFGQAMNKELKNQGFWGEHESYHDEDFKIGEANERLKYQDWGKSPFDKGSYGNQMEKVTGKISFLEEKIDSILKILQRA